MEITSATTSKLSSSVPTFECVNTLDFKTTVYALATLNQSRFAVGGGAREGSEVAIWDTAGTPYNPPPEVETITSLASADNGSSLITGGMRAFSDHGGYLKVWPLGSTAPSYNKQLESVVSSLASHPNNRWIVTGDWDGVIKIWDRSSPDSQPFNFPNKEGYVNALAFVQNGDYLTSGHSKNIHVQEMKHYTYLSPYIGHTDAVLALSDMGNGILASGSADKTIKIWDTTKPSNQAFVKTLPIIHKDAVFALARWSDTILVSGSADSSFVVWDITTGDYWQCPQAHEGAVKALTVCNNMLITGSFDKSVKIWQPKN
ncbi:MAG: hypothetical protein JSR58_03130 [Verrucomicrobia bacterium]|nr:hypothetical protein [Verrucomicrobiota bacterium]